MYRANYGDGTYSPAYPDIRDAKLAKWGRAAIVHGKPSCRHARVRTARRLWKSVRKQRTGVPWRTRLPSRYFDMDTHTTGRARFCSTCGRAPGSPFRVYDVHGKVISGCVDDFHTGHLITPSESARWHNRPVSKQIRRTGELSQRYGYDRSQWPKRYQRG